jgi:hypothetical protein
MSVDNAAALLAECFAKAPEWAVADIFVEARKQSIGRSALFAARNAMDPPVRIRKQGNRMVWVAGVSPAAGMIAPMAPMIASILRSEREADPRLVGELLAAHCPRLPLNEDTYRAVAQRELDAMCRVGLAEKRGQKYALPPIKQAMIRCSTDE